MYKFSNTITNAKLVFVRRQFADGTCASLVVMRAPRRAAHDSCKPPPKPKSRKLLWGLIGATVLTGAGIVYAKHSPDARNWLETNLPAANDVVALVYQENQTYWDFTKHKFNNVTTSISHFLFGQEGVTPMEFPTRQDSNVDDDAAKAYAKKSYCLPPPTFSPLFVEEKKLETPEVETPAMLVQTEKCDPVVPPTITITKDVVELEKDMHENTKIAIDNYKEALKYCKEYNKALYKVVETPLEDLDKKNYTQLQGALNERDSRGEKAQVASAKAKYAMDSLEKLLKDDCVEAPPESIASTNRHLKIFRKDLQEAEDEYNACLEKATLSEKYKSKVEEARNAYKKELELLFPGIDLSAKRLELKGDTDLLLVYTLKQISHLQNELAELQTIRDVKINRALECHDEKAIIDAKIEDEVKREKLAKEIEFQKKSLQVQAEANKKLKEELRKQYELQQDVMEDKLKRKEKEVLGKYNRQVSEQVEKERVEFKKEMAAMAGKLQAIEQTLKQRANSEQEARRSQSVWAAAEALLAATRRSDSETKVENEIKALEKAGKDDKLVQTVMKGIPKEAREEGIATERTIKDKFNTMENTAKKVALIGRDGASLPVYFLSWLQSKLLCNKFAEIPKDELDNKPTDFTELDTFDIIHRARYYMDQGNLGVALRYVNLLQGAPRAAAAPWVESAKRHLEVKQAAEAVMAHASASGQLHS